MEHEYQLVRPAFDTIVDYCNDLEANEKLIVFEFGWNCDLVLHRHYPATYVVGNIKYKKVNHSRNKSRSMHMRNDEKCRLCNIAAVYSNDKLEYIKRSFVSYAAIY